MIKDRETWEKWEADYIRRTPVDFERNFAIYESLYQEARALGILPPAYPLEGLEDKIRFVKAINASATLPKDRK